MGLLEFAILVIAIALFLIVGGWSLRVLNWLSDAPERATQNDKWQATLNERLERIEQRLEQIEQHSDRKDKNV